MINEGVRSEVIKITIEKKQKKESLSESFAPGSFLIII